MLTRRWHLGMLRFQPNSSYRADGIKVYVCIARCSLTMILTHKSSSSLELVYKLFERHHQFISPSCTTSTCLNVQELAQSTTRLLPLAPIHLICNILVHKRTNKRKHNIHSLIFLLLQYTLDSITTDQSFQIQWQPNSKIKDRQPSYWKRFLNWHRHCITRLQYVFSKMPGLITFCNILFLFRWKHCRPKRALTTDFKQLWDSRMQMM